MSVSASDVRLEHPHPSAHAAPRDAARTRTFSWSDPLASARRGDGMTGLAYLRAIADGALPQPPILVALDARLAEVDHGRAVFASTPGEMHYNLIGSVHGGYAATLIDSATGCAVMSALEAGDRWTTLHLAVDYLAAMDRETGPLTCEARIVRLGRRVGVADATLVDARGRVYARGSSTCLVMRG